MSVKVYVDQHEIWEFFASSLSRMSEEMVLIAENEETSYAVYLTEDSGYPMLVVARGDAEPEYSEPCVSDDDCVAVSKKLFKRYLVPVVVSSEMVVDTDPNEETMQEDDIMYERDDELIMAMSDFLSVAVSDANQGAEDDVIDMYGTGFVEEVLDHVLQYLTSEHRLRIYRPTMMTDPETGETVLTEYPYEEIETDFPENEQNN